MESFYPYRVNMEKEEKANVVIDSLLRVSGLASLSIFFLTLL